MSFNKKTNTLQLCVYVVSEKKPVRAIGLAQNFVDSVNKQICRVLQTSESRAFPLNEKLCNVRFLHPGATFNKINCREKESRNNIVF
jgi:hypothetical protein